jgi:hypothetical protein
MGITETLWHLYCWVGTPFAYSIDWRHVILRGLLPAMKFLLDTALVLQDAEDAMPTGWEIYDCGCHSASYTYKFTACCFYTT